MSRTIRSITASSRGSSPKGEYGGGTVLLWDRGTWIPLDPDPEAAYRKGSLKFTLNGEKLHGNWALVRMGGKAASERRENWLLIKERDDEAVPQSGDAVVDGQSAQRRDRPLARRDRRRSRLGLAFEPGRGRRRQPQRRRPGRCNASPAPARAGCPDDLKPQLATSVGQGAGRRRMAARDQIRRLSPARPHRGRQGPADHSRRSRLDRQIPGAGARLGAAAARHRR